MGIRDWSWRTPTAHGLALDAFQKGQATYEVTLEILQPGYQRTLDAIFSAGWRLDRQVTHPRTRTTKVTPKYDGGHEVVKTVTQQATFYFVRGAGPGMDWRPPTPAFPAASPQVAQPSIAPTWPAGWYPTERGLQWWDGTRWAPPHVPQTPYEALPYESDYAGLSNGEIALHLGLTLLTCGLWLPVWIGHARRRREGR